MRTPKLRKQISRKFHVIRYSNSKQNAKQYWLTNLPKRYKTEMKILAYNRALLWTSRPWMTTFWFRDKIRQLSSVDKVLSAHVIFYAAISHVPNVLYKYNFNWVVPLNSKRYYERFKPSINTEYVFSLFRYNLSIVFMIINNNGIYNGVDEESWSELGVDPARG